MNKICLNKDNVLAYIKLNTLGRMTIGMVTYDVIIDTVTVSQLDFDASAQRWEHLCEDYLFIPHWFIASLLHCGLTLNTSTSL